MRICLKQKAGEKWLDGKREWEANRKEKGGGEGKGALPPVASSGLPGEGST